MSPASQPANGAPRRRARARRRPGRFRRWLLRPAVWLLVVLLLLLAAVPLVLRSGPVRRWAAEVASERLAAYLQREVEIEALDLTLLPFSVEATGLRIGGLEPGGPAFAEADKVYVELDLRGLRDPLLTLRQARLERPYVRLEFPTEGGHNIPIPPRRRRRPPGEPQLKVLVQYVAIDGGVLELGHERLPLDLEARQLRARLSGRGGVELQGTASAQEVAVTLPRARPFVGAVGVRGSFEPGRVEIGGGRVSAPDMSAAVSGAFTWGETKELSLQVDAEGSTDFFRELGYLDDQVAGRFEVTGDLSWRRAGAEPGVWRFAGDLGSPAIRVVGRTLDDVRGRVAGDREGVRIEVDRAGHGGGTLDGFVAFRYGAGAERTGEVDLELAGVDLQQFLADQDLPIRGLAGRVSGPFNYRFPFGDARRGRGWADLEIEPPAQPAPGDMALAGSVPLLIENGMLRTRAARLLGASQQVRAQGAYDLERRRGAFDFEIDSQRLTELLARLTFLDVEGEPPLWRPTAGWGEIDGQLALSPGDVSARLELDLLGIESPGVRADRVRGGLSASRRGLSGLRLELTRPEAGLIVSGSVPFAGPDESTPAPPFELGVYAAGWPLAETQPWLPFELPVDGPVTGSLALTGSPESLRGELRAEVAPVVYRGLTGDGLRLDLAFDPERVYFRELVLATAAGDTRVAGELETASGELAMSLAAAGLAVDRPPFSDWLPGALAGDLAVEGTIGGTLERPRLEADLAWRDLTLDGRPLGKNGDTETRVDWDGDRLVLEGTLFGLLALEGGGRYDGASADLDLRVAATDLRAVAGMLTTAELPEFSGSAAGRFTVRGDVAGEAPLAAALELDTFRLLHAGRQIENLEPVVVRLDPEAVVIDSFFVAVPGTSSELFVGGRVELDAAKTLRLQLQASLETTWIDELLPELGLRAGSFDALATIGGTLERPEINGQGQLRDARLVPAALPHALDDVRSVVLFYPGQLVIDSLRARVAGGEVVAGGSVKLYDTETGEPTYRLQATAKQLNLRYPEGWLTRADAEIQVVSVAGGRQIRGLVELDRALYLQDVKLGLGQLLQGLFARRRVEVETADEALATTQLNLAIRGPQALRVRNNVADLRGGIDLTLRGSLARPVVFGRVELEPQGKLVYAGNEYEIERGQLTFANPVRIEPVIDLVATTDVREYDVTLNLSGTLERLNADFSSDPPLADLEVLSLLTSGTAIGGTTVDQTSTAGLGAEKLLYGQASSLIAERVNRLFGLDKFRIDPLTGAAGNLSSARVTVGKRLSRDLFATYSYDPSITEQQILQLEWRVRRGLVLVLTQNGDDTYAADLRLEKSF